MVSKEMQEYLSKNCIGAKCEVMTESNLLLYIGILAGYRRDVSQIQVDIHRGDIVPQYVVHKSPVRVRVRMPGYGLLLIYGKVIGMTRSFYRIEVVEAVRSKEHREYFRQRLDGKAVVTLAGAGSPQPESVCQLVDVSLNGISFRSRTAYAQESNLILSDVYINKHAKPYTFRVLVRRVGRDTESGWFVYGCRFLDLPEKDENRLSGDIVRLQAEDIYRVSQ